MSWLPAVSILAFGIPAITGWIVVHFLTQRRSLRDAREQRLQQHLIDDFRAIEDVAKRELPHDNEEKRRLEQALADIQLLGSDHEIEAALDFISSYKGAGTLNRLLTTLRRSLRS